MVTIEGTLNSINKLHTNNPDRYVYSIHINNNEITIQSDKQLDKVLELGSKYRIVGDKKPFGLSMYIEKIYKVKETYEEIDWHG